MVIVPMWVDELISLFAIFISRHLNHEYIFMVGVLIAIHFTKVPMMIVCLIFEGEE